MWSFTKAEGLSPEQIAELKNQWFSIDEAIEELAVNGARLTESTFRREAKEVNTDKDFLGIGKPQVKKEKVEGKGRPRQIYNRAFIEALRANAISDTYKRIEEEPIAFFTNNDWKAKIEAEFREILDEYIKGPEAVDSAVEELLLTVGNNIIEKYYSIIAQNKLLVHQNKKLEDTKEYYIALYRGVEENANVLNDLAIHIKNDISESSSALSRKEVYHLNQTLKVNNKLDEILKSLNETKVKSGKS
ncbi:hypothetical protein BACSP_02025 [Bacillus sp. T2.9-1]|uniref:hypothetical protein n=1 Tax=Bacillus sp. T2.9-1 TaxID=3041163 RepID=UPI0024776816|nr:hypothetical protein [Bacillus sp. T2.9-1]CAI9387539.1 hypothetical protein BACSP_02025 [Bacillus sp. T2.9-1]